MDPLSELPIEDGARRRLRKSGTTPTWQTTSILIGVGLFGVLLVWQFARSDPAGDPLGDSPTTTVPTSATEDVADETPIDDEAAPVTLSRQSDVAWIEPSSSLSDGVEVTLTAAGPFLTQGDPGMALCRRGRTVACTNLATGPVTSDGETSSVTMTLMRRFVDWQGNEQDCVTIAPCELRMWSFNTRIDELNLEIDFDPAAPLRESNQAIGAEGLLSAVDDLDLTLPTSGALVVRQCIAGAIDGCAAGATVAPVRLTAADEQGDYRLFPRRRMVTTRGPHDCVTDGPCELRFETDDSHRIAPLPLAFEPDDVGAVDPPTVMVRPSSDLGERDLVEVRIANSPSAVASLWLCASQVPTCISLTTASATEATVISVPRFIEDRHNRDPEAQVIDCASTTCEIRAAIAGEFVVVPITFAASTATLPEAQVVVATDGPFASGDEIRIVGRGLYVNVLPNDPFVSTRVRFCESVDATPADCISTAGFSSGIQPDGTVDALLQIPDFDRRQTIRTGAVVPVSFCLDSCWLVVEARLEVPGVAIPVEIVDRG